ncbi:hypothetical protein AYO47_04695 [Planctomyces sp. SCGC AG-212-M04]|nr:hypothetical protein AYO47_04695 [Planctomyces sp. SCGC AG-212-M04]
MRPYLLVLMLMGVVQSRATAQEKSEGPVRLLYSAKSRSAGDLELFLKKHYAGVDTLKFALEPHANILSIRAENQAALDDVLKSLATVDATPRSITFQAIVIDAAVPQDGAAAIELDRTQLTGDAQAVLKVARDWVKEGKVARARTFAWTCLENQIGEHRVGEIVPRVTAMTVTNRGQFPNYTDTNLGTIFSVIPKIVDPNDIVCELIYNNSELDPKSIPEQKPNAVVEPGRIRQCKVQLTVNIAAGRSVVISARDAGPEGPASLVVLSAAITNPNAPPPAAAAAPPGVTAFRGEVFSSSVVTSSMIPSLLLSQYRSDEFTKVITLTDEQKKKLEELSAERDKLTAEMSTKMRERRGPPDAEGRDELNAISTKRRDVDERALNLLTADQKKAFENFTDEYRRGLRDRGRAGFADPAAGPTVTITGGNRLSSVNRSLQRSPNDPRYLVMRGQIYAAEEKWDEAIADYRKALEGDSRSLLAVTELAAILAFRGDEAGYRQFAEQLLERFGNEGSPAEKLRVADACLLRPEWLPNAAVAEAMLERALKAIPPEGIPQPRARIDIGNAIGLPLTSLASSTAQDVLVARGRLHILRSQPDEAIALLKPFLEESQAAERRSRPDLEVSALCSLAIAQLSKGHKESAQSSIIRARSIQSEGPWPRVASGAFSTFELTSKARLARTEQILNEAGVKPAADVK